MIFIFKGFDVSDFITRIQNNKAVIKFTDFAKANKTKIKYTALSIFGVCLVAVTLMLAGVRVAVKVSYLGKDIAIVKNEEVFANALIIANANICGESAKGAIGTPKFSLTVTVTDKLQSASNLADNIIKNTNDIEYASALSVDGEIKAVVKGDRTEEYLERRRTAFYTKGAQNTAEFISDVKVVKGYYLKTDIKDFSFAKKAIDKLEVKTVSVIKRKTEIPYKTIKKTTNKQNVGYSKVVTAGCNGTTVKTVRVENVNGKVVLREQLSKEVVSKPVNKVVLVGTAVKTVSATERANASSAGFICPLNRGSFCISAYWGDGRNHKALDLAADRGTPIFAAGGGTVTYAGYDSDFGYNVIIKHSNGISTRYAHANALCVSYGQVVSQGEMIATVGSTGWSTGNHLHFEVLVNGVRVNPAPYIGL